MLQITPTITPIAFGCATERRDELASLHVTFLRCTRPLCTSIASPCRFCVECAGPIRRPLTVVAAERKGMRPLCLGIAPMKAYMLITGSGPIVILTSHDSVVDAALIKKLASKGIEKFIAYEIPIGLAQERYGAHFTIVQGDVREADDLRVLDYDGSRAFKLFRFNELGTPLLHEPSS